MSIHGIHTLSQCPYVCISEWVRIYVKPIWFEKVGLHIIIQYLHPEGPCSPGGSSAAVAIQEQTLRLGQILVHSWRLNVDSFFCESTSGILGSVWTKSRTLTENSDDFMLQILTSATLTAGSADGRADLESNRTRGFRLTKLSVQ